MKRLLKLLKKPKSSAGFTLIELLVAMAITTIVIGITGWGVVAITQKSKEQKLETDRRVELNRALDFMADEVRQAKPIATNASANLSTIAPGFSSTNKTPILTLQIPNGSQPFTVIYYIAAKPSGSPWLGPNIIYRWGPKFNANGTYSDPTISTNLSDEPLVDLMSDTTPSSNPNCDTNWTPNPAVASRTGFYACVDPSGKIADIHLRGKLVDAYGNPQTAVFKVSNKVFARPNNAPFTLGSSTAPSSGSGGTLTITQPSTGYFEVLGGDMLCGAAGQIPTHTKLKYTPNGQSTPTTLNVPDTGNKALNVSLGVGDKLTVTGISDALSSCGGFGGYEYNSETNKTTQVWSLRNGDTVPSITPFTGQAGIDTFLTKYINPTTGKVKLADNQVIYLFELFTTDQNLIINGSRPYDMQDLIVLATIAPTQ